MLDIKIGFYKSTVNHVKPISITPQERHKPCSYNLRDAIRWISTRIYGHALQ